MRRFLDRPRTDWVRYATVTTGLTIGVWQGNYLLGGVIALVGYLASAFVAHPRDAIGYWRRWPAYRRYLAAVRSGYGEQVDLGDFPEQARLALAGALAPFRLFVSSTFLDLEAERDRLAKDVFPRLARECERRGAVWAPIDLRWGITEIQKNAGEVARNCLDSVDRSRPNAIGVVGSRYGTRIPSGRTGTGTVAHPPGAPTRLRAGPEGLVGLRDGRGSHGDDALRVGAMVHELRAAGASVVDGVRDADHLVDLAGADLLRRWTHRCRTPGSPTGHCGRFPPTVSRRSSTPGVHASTAALSSRSGHVSQGRMAILRGAPGSGRSTLGCRLGARLAGGSSGPHRGVPIRGADRGVAVLASAGAQHRR